MFVSIKDDGVIIDREAEGAICAALNGDGITVSIIGDLSQSHISDMLAAMIAESFDTLADNDCNPFITLMFLKFCIEKIMDDCQEA